MMDTKKENNIFSINHEHFFFFFNRTDIAFFDSAYLGTLLRIRIEHDNSGFQPGWFLDKVIVENTGDGQVYEFPCNRNLNVLEDDGAISRDLNGELVYIIY